VIATTFGTIVLGILAVSVRLAYGTWWHPAVLFPTVWATIHGCILAASSLGFYQIDLMTAGLFVAGAVSFSVGGVVGETLTQAVSRRPGERRTREDLDYSAIARASLALHAAMLPVWWRSARVIAGDVATTAAFARELRVKAVTGEAIHGSLVGNYLVLGLIVVPVLVIGRLRGRIPLPLVALASFPWLVANLFSNGRGALVQLVIAVSYLYVTGRTRLGSRALVAAAGAFAAVFVSGAVLVGKQGIAGESKPSGIARLAVENFADYTLQGPILFSRYLSGQLAVESTWDALGFPCAVLRRFDLCEPGPLHQEYGEFSEHGRSGNVYSVFFSVYPKYGITGVVVILGLYGAWACAHHRRHVVGASLADSLLASYLASAVVLSIFSDLFGPSLNFFVKAVLVCTLLQMVFGRRCAPAEAAVAETNRRTCRGAGRSDLRASVWQPSIRSSASVPD
jgi:oligosaccharide repeat unit polymerase